MSSPTESAIAEAMNRLWEKYLPQIEERVTTLQDAAESLANGNLTPDNRRNAASEAHKLAGVLGTFGLDEGTNLAREAESLYENFLEDIAPLASRLVEIAGQLKQMVAARK